MFDEYRWTCVRICAKADDRSQVDGNPSAGDPPRSTPLDAETRWQRHSHVHEVDRGVIITTIDDTIIHQGRNEPLTCRSPRWPPIVAVGGAPSPRR